MCQRPDGPVLPKNPFKKFLFLQPHSKVDITTGQNSSNKISMEIFLIDLTFLKEELSAYFSFRVKIKRKTKKKLNDPS